MSDYKPDPNDPTDVKMVEMTYLATSRVSGRFVVEAKIQTPVFGSDRDAALLLELGREVDWCPGDATRYRLLLAKGPEDVYLLVTNMDAMIRIHRTEQHFTAADYVRNGGPRGGWAGLRPIITALGHRPMEPLVYNVKDAEQESFFRKQESRR